jgi:hypothetical protein
MKPLTLILMKILTVQTIRDRSHENQIGESFVSAAGFLAEPSRMNFISDVEGSTCLEENRSLKFITDKLRSDVSWRPSVKLIPSRSIFEITTTICYFLCFPDRFPSIPFA